LGDSARALCWFGWLDDGTYLSLPSLRLAMDRYNAALLDVCFEMEAPCVDLSPMNGRVEFFYDDCHFNNAGAREVARILAEFLLRTPQAFQ